MKTKEWLVGWFRNHSAMTVEEIVSASAANYMESGMIDSFSFVMMLSDIDDEFGISFTNEDFLNPLFTTIDGLAQIIEERKE